MALFPTTPLPSSVSAPAIVESILRFESDQGYAHRRPKRSRPLRRYTLDYLGKTTTEMRYIRDFLLQHRLSAVPFEFYHATATDRVTIAATTPVICTYEHGLFTGQQVFVGASSHSGLTNNIWTVTRLDHQQLALNGSVAGPAGTADLVVYLPFAIGSFSSDTWDSPTKLIGPEHTGQAREGLFSFSVTIEEIF